MAKVQVMYDLARLAFETDSTRAITLMLNSVGTPVVQIAGATITDSYHNLSHHGMAEEKLTQLKVIDEWHMKLLADLFKGLKSAKEDGETLLDRTMVLYGSNLGDANAHSTTNLPTLFAGGGFQHGQHLAFDRGRNYPLPNLFVSMLQRMGIEEAELRPLDRHDARPGDGLSHDDTPERSSWRSSAASASPADDPAIITFDKVETGKPMPSYTDRGVVFALSHPPAKSQAAGRVMFFPHLKTPRKGILNAMANESIPVEVRFPKPVSSVTLVLWGSIGSAALVEAYDKDGKVVDRAKRDKVPERTGPEQPIPSFELTVKASAIAYVRFSGAPPGGYLVCDEVRFTPRPDPAK